MKTKRILWILALGVFGIATTEFGVIGILSQIAAAFDVTIEKAGWLLSGFALIVAAFGPFLMLILSGLNRKRLMLFILFVFAVSNILSVVASNFNMLLFARVLPAFMHPVFWSIALSTASKTLPSEQSPKAVGIVFGGFTVASVLGVPLATLMADLFNWQASFVLCAIINGLSFLGVLLLLPSTPPVQRQTLGSQVKILKKTTLWISFTLSCLMIAAMYSTYGYIADYLENIVKMNGAQISLMLFVFGITGVGGNWLAGKLLSKNILTTTIVFILALTVVHLLLYFFGLYFFPMVVMIAVWGFVHTGGFLISNINFTTSAPEAPEFVNSIFTTCGNLAVTIGSLIGGFWITHFNIHNVIWSSVLLLALSVLAWTAKRFVINKIEVKEIRVKS